MRKDDVMAHHDHECRSPCSLKNDDTFEYSPHPVYDVFITCVKNSKGKFFNKQRYSYAHSTGDPRKAYLCQYRHPNTPVFYWLFEIIKITQRTFYKSNLMHSYTKRKRWSEWQRCKSVVRKYWACNNAPNCAVIQCHASASATVNRSALVNYTTREASKWNFTSMYHTTFTNTHEKFTLYNQKLSNQKTANTKISCNHHWVA